MSHPSHIAIIMDGNGRWAEKRKHARTFGHARGTKTAKNLIEFCIKTKIKYLTLFTLSTENLNRPKKEVDFLMQVLEKNIKKKSKLLINNNVQLKCIGNIELLPSSIKKALEDLIDQTATCNGMTLTLAINYSSQQEITQATRAIAEKVKKQEILPEQINELFFASHLESHFLPSPDLIIRTGEEKRLSNFLLWQAAYSELYFTDILWPDFDAIELSRAIDNFKSTQRRFGLTPNQIKSNHTPSLEKSL